MSFWYDTAKLPANPTFAVGQSTLGEIYSAATEQLRFVENSNASAEALTRAYGDRIRAIQSATGETTTNPMETRLDRGTFEARPNPNSFASPDTPDYRAQKLQTAVDGFNTWLADVAKRYPDQAGVIRADQPIEKDAEAIARNSDQRLAKTLAARDGIGKWGALFAGGGVGSLYDPLQAVTLLAGGGPGAARTVGGRILTTALKEAAINGLVEAAMQPTVQAWREQVGLEAGWNEAVKNVALAAGLGGVLGGMFQGGAEAAGRIFRGADLDRAAETVAAQPSVRTEIREAIGGDAAKAADALAPIRDALPAEARGAIDAMSTLRELDEVRPKAATAEVHETAVSRAMQAVQQNSPYIFEPDPTQVERIVARLVPDAPPPARDQTATLQQFLMRAGGVEDFRGELDALGLTNVSERFTGRLVREGGMPLDEARRAAAEEGYFNHLYGTPEQAMEKSTVRDLLDELDTAARASSSSEIDDGGRAYASGLVHELVGRAGPAVDDELILKAAELANAEGLAPADALDRVLIQADEADRAAEVATRAPAAPERIDPIEMRGGLDDPGKPIEDTFFTNADLEDLPEGDIPFFDGELRAPDELLAEIERLENLSHLVEACRV